MAIQQRLHFGEAATLSEKVVSGEMASTLGFSVESIVVEVTDPGAGITFPTTNRTTTNQTTTTQSFVAEVSVEVSCSVASSAEQGVLCNSSTTLEEAVAEGVSAVSGVGVPLLSFVQRHMSRVFFVFRG